MAGFKGFRYHCLKCLTNVDKCFFSTRFKCPVCGNVMNYMSQIVVSANKQKGGDPKP